MVRKLEPGLVEMYSRSRDLITSTMKSEPGRSTTMSPGGGLSFPRGRESNFAAASAADWAPASAGAPAAATPTAVVFRNVRRSRLPFFSSDIRLLLAFRIALPRRKSLTLRIAARTQFRIEEHDRQARGFGRCRRGRRGRRHDRDDRRGRRRRGA